MHLPGNLLVELETTRLAQKDLRGSWLSDLSSFKAAFEAAAQEFVAASSQKAHNVVASEYFSTEDMAVV